MSETLDRFVHAALTRGLARDDVRTRLLEAGWPEDEVASALDAWVDVDFPIPVPRPKPYTSAADAFGYLVLFTTLYVSAFALIQLIYQLINRALPDAAASAYSIASALGATRWSAAALLIAFPLFLWLSWRSHRETRSDPAKRTSRIRKWLTYLTLFLAATALICDVITLVYFLLSGDLTARFVLKIVTLAAVAGAVFGYYLWDLKQGDRDPDQLSTTHPGLRLFTGAVVLVTLASVVAGIVVAGTPTRARDERLDHVRLQHLSSIAASVDRFWKRRGALPPDLDTLIRQRLGAPVEIRDPATEEPYEYLPAEDGSYELCAVFEMADAHPRLRHSSGDAFWAHGEGRHCYQLHPSSD